MKRSANGVATLFQHGRPPATRSPHRLRIAYSWTLSGALPRAEDLPQERFRQMTELVGEATHPRLRQPVLEKFERARKTIWLDLGDLHLPLCSRPVDAPCLPPLVMLFPGNLLLLPFPLQSLEQGVAKTKLRQLFSWLEQQRDLASDHYSDLWRIKGFSLFYAKIKEMALKEMRLIKEYRNGWDKVHEYRLFSCAELSELELSYAQILMAAICIMDRLLELTASFQPPLTGSLRMPGLRDTAEQLERLYLGLIEINEEIGDLSRHRLKSARIPTS